jgi:hypothetical protein
MNRTDGDGPFNLMQTFPRKVYTEDDMMRNLTDLGNINDSLYIYLNKYIKYLTDL